MRKHGLKAEQRQALVRKVLRKSQEEARVKRVRDDQRSTIERVFGIKAAQPVVRAVARYEYIARLKSPTDDRYERIARGEYEQRLTRPTGFDGMDGFILT